MTKEGTATALHSRTSSEISSCSTTSAAGGGQKTRESRQSRVSFVGGANDELDASHHGAATEVDSDFRRRSSSTSFAPRSSKRSSGNKDRRSSRCSKLAESSIRRASNAVSEVASRISHHTRDTRRYIITRSHTNVLNDEKNADIVIARRLWQDHRLLPPHSDYRDWWDIVLLGCMLYTIFIIPMRIVFNEVEGLVRWTPCTPCLSCHVLAPGVCSLPTHGVHLLPTGFIFSPVEVPLH